MIAEMADNITDMNPNDFDVTPFVYILENSRYKNV